MTDWSDVAARARGLSGRLLTAAQWRALARVRDIEALTRQLTAFGGVGPVPDELSGAPRAVETAILRRAGARLRLVGAWAGDRAGRIAPLFADEDRRSLRAIVRGVLAGVPYEERSQALIPTATLPLRALEQLARTHDIKAVAAQLLAWGHPSAAAVAEAAGRQHPDLFGLEVAINRAFAARAVAAARAADRPMRLFVERTVDVENVWNALALAAGAGDADADAVFVDGGRLVRRGDLEQAAASLSPHAVRAALRPRVAGTPLAAALEPTKGTHEDRALDSLTGEFRRLALRDPLSTAPIIAFVLRQRTEVRVLLHVTWGVALGAPAQMIEDSIGVAA